jgi:hypothetical protein
MTMRRIPSSGIESMREVVAGAPEQRWNSHQFVTRYETGRRTISMNDFPETTTSTVR